MTFDGAGRSAVAEVGPRPGLEIGPRPGLEIRPHNCFACGSLNTHGLRLELHLETGRAWTETTLGERFEGWEGIAHGGIVATLLDEVMAWSLIAVDHWGMTARMTVEFRRPAPIDRPVRADGRIVRDRRRLFETAAELIDVASGEVVATATAVYAAATGARRAEMEARYGVLRPSPTAPGPAPEAAEPEAPAPDAGTAPIAPGAR